MRCQDLVNAEFITDRGNLESRLIQSGSYRDLRITERVIWCAFNECVFRELNCTTRGLTSIC